MITTDPDSWKEGNLVFLVHGRNLIIGVVTRTGGLPFGLSGNSIHYNYIMPTEYLRKGYFDTVSAAYSRGDIYNPKDSPYRAIKDLFKTKI